MGSQTSKEYRAQKALSNLRTWLEEAGKVMVAFSGGLDSGFLSAVAVEVLGPEAIGVILVSPLIPQNEVLEAREMAREIGLHLREIPFPVLQGSIIQNPRNRCYLCRKLSARLILDASREEGARMVVDGVNLSDFQEHRPGMRAWEEAGIRHPLAESGFNKDDVRFMAREMGLTFWDKSPYSCLATRVAYDQELNLELLQRIEMAEEELELLGFSSVRVRVHGSLARIELQEEDMELAFTQRILIVNKLRPLGFTYVTLDLEGYRSGSMDRTLPEESQSQ